jgi:hypothetical protein
LDDTPPYAKKNKTKRKNKIKSPVGVMRMEEFRELISGVGEKGPNQNPQTFFSTSHEIAQKQKNVLKKKVKMGLV